MAVQYDIGDMGQIDLGETLRLPVQCRNGSGVVTAPDSAPSWSMYTTDDTAKLTGSLGASDADSKTGFRTGDADITAANGFAAGDRVIVRISYAISSTEYASVGFFRVT